MKNANDVLKFILQLRITLTETFEEGNIALSNYTSDESHIKPNKRLIVPNKRLLSSDDEQVFKKIKNTNAFSMPDMPTYESFDNEENLHLNLDSIALKDCSNNQDNSIIVISHVNTENTHPPVFQSDNKVIDIGGSQNNEYHQIFHFFKEISEQYQSIQRTLDVIKIDIQDLQRQIEYQGVNKKSSESSLVEENLILPFSTLDELNDHESKLTDNNIYEKAMKRTLLKVGSSKLNSKTTYNVLRNVMTNEIAETFNVTGKRLKLSFNNYKMSKLIQDVVYVLQNITETEYKTYLGQWLRQASNRKNEKKNLIV